MILADRDPLRSIIWAGALVLVSLEMIVRPRLAWQAADATAMPFLTLLAIILAAALADRMGAFAFLARVVIPASASSVVSVAAVLLFTAALSGLVNLDVAVVVASPVAIRVAGRSGVSAARLAAAVAVTANATSFLIPTSNVTTLLLLSRASVRATTYVGGSWVAWILVTALTVGALSPLVSRGQGGAVPTTSGGGCRLGAVIDLVPMFLAASAIRGLLPAGVVLHGGFIERVAVGSAFGAAANNLPAAAAVHSAGASGVWAAVLAMSVGPNLLITGSVATLICRRIARDRGVTVRVRTFMELGAFLVPLQLAAAFLGLRFMGAVR